MGGGRAWSCGCGGAGAGGGSARSSGGEKPRLGKTSVPRAVTRETGLAGIAALTELVLSLEKSGLLVDAGEPERENVLVKPRPSPALSVPWGLPPM